MKKKIMNIKLPENTYTKVVVLIAIIFVFLVIKAVFIKPVDVSKEVNKVIGTSGRLIVYVTNSKRSKCSNCKDIKKYLDKEKIKYIVFDVNKKSDKEYKELLKKLKINEKLFNYPAIIYIQDNIMFANIINISDTDTVSSFIADYDLTSVK